MGNIHVKLFEIQEEISFKEKIMAHNAPQAKIDHNSLRLR